MKVAIIGKYYPTYHGGIERHIRNLCEELGGSIALEVYASNDSFHRYVESIADVPVYRAASFGTLFSTPVSPGLLCRIIRSKADLYHLHLPNPVGELALMARPSSRFIVTYHSDVVNPRAPFNLYSPLLKRTLRCAQTIIVASEPYLKTSPMLHNYQDKCIIIPYGVNKEKFKINVYTDEKIKAYRKKFGDRIILFVGRLRYYKGVEYLIRAMRNCDAALIVAGEGDKKSDYQKIVRLMRMERKVHFLGKVADEDLPALYHSCRMFVLPSINRGESFGIVLLEAMACGKPVISTELGTGTSWVNQHGVTGYVVPPCDSGALNKAMTALLYDQEQAKIMGENGSKRVYELFNTKEMGRKMLSVYQKAVTMKS